MITACFLTVLALSSVAVGLLLGRRRHASVYLGAAGGGLLFGIAVFWILPEIASQSGWPIACSLVMVASLGMVWLDRSFEHSHSLPGRIVIGPLLMMAAIHSFLDGWSLRAVSREQITSIVIPLGLALHKIPEGLALGWLAGHSSVSRSKALSWCFLAEAMTIAGAWAEPGVDQSATGAFGVWWMAVVLAVIAGSFLFLAVHTVLPMRQRTSVMAVFLATTLSLGGVALYSRI